MLVPQDRQVLSALPKSAHPGARRALAEIWNAEDRDHARRAVAAFKLAYSAKFGKAVAKIVDDNEWKKVEEGVYTGFSPGGRYAKRWQDGAYRRYTPDVRELSIVDVPCNPSATFTMVKADGGMHVVDTVGGCKLTLKVDGDKVTITDESGGVANVTVADVIQSNGVIHVIDKVLLPKM